MSHNPLCSKLRDDLYCDCWERVAVALLAENHRLRATLEFCSDYRNREDASYHAQQVLMEAHSLAVKSIDTPDQTGKRKDER